MAAAAVFVLSSVGAWWLWTQHGLARFGASSYQVPPLNVGLALIAAVGLVIAALSLGRAFPKEAQAAARRARSP